MSVAVVENDKRELNEYGVYNSETDINNNPKTGENKPSELVSFLSQVTERLSAIREQLGEVKEMLKENDKITHTSIDTCIAELESYMKSIEEETTIKDTSGVE